MAQGIKLANHDLKVIAVTGDGDGYGIGQGHFIHAMRRNADITHVVENNQVYGLTKGQYSPTSERGYISSFSPEGAMEFAINPIALALSAGATFIARASAADPKHMNGVLQAAITHKGYSIVDCLQPCVTYNKINTYDWYRSRTYKVDEEPGYDKTSRVQAYEKAEFFRNTVEAMEFTIPTSMTPIRATMSFGVAQRENARQTSNEIVHNADLALYNSKLRGRNRTFAHTNNVYLDFPSDQENRGDSSAGIDMNSRSTYMLETFTPPPTE